MAPGLVGRWKVVACQLNGRWLPDAIFREFRYVIAADGRFALEWGDLSFGPFVGGFPKSKSGAITFSPGEKGTVDLIPDDGPLAGKTFSGVFELDHDVLKANFGLPGHPRATAFAAGHGQVYEVWVRVGGE